MNVKFQVDAIRPLQKYNTLRILCDDNTDISEFKLSKPLPQDLETNLQALINYLDKYDLNAYLDTLEQLIQYLSDSDIKLEAIQGISYSSQSHQSCRKQP